ncbi:hypothetical protein HOE31_00605 [bacterium]|jgi:hypothetical protein|nr:hypothetical protein [bacterium]MBT4121434.1 hypothetical protein [bacterium]MBT4335318.1 hypothetical protein [bacterium]MBT4495404.1 hypothetical protein [bacterium]MBT4763629.1 hypothetical protein [bacterium]
MKKYFSKKSIMASAATILWVVPMIVGAQVDADFGLGYPAATGLGTNDLKDTIIAVLNVLLGFLGIIAVIVILLGGFKWMTAAGNEDKVAEAKKLLGAGIVGIIIILSAYAIATYVITQIQTSTGGTLIE